MKGLIKAGLGLAALAGLVYAAKKVIDNTEVYVEVVGAEPDAEEPETQAPETQTQQAPETQESQAPETQAPQAPETQAQQASETQETNEQDDKTLFEKRREDLKKNTKNLMESLADFTRSLKDTAEAIYIDVKDGKVVDVDSENEDLASETKSENGKNIDVDLTDKDTSSKEKTDCDINDTPVPVADGSNIETDLV